MRSRTSCFSSICENVGYCNYFCIIVSRIPPSIISQPENGPFQLIPFSFSKAHVHSITSFLHVVHFFFIHLMLLLLVPPHRWLLKIVSILGNRPLSFHSVISYLHTSRAHLAIIVTCISFLELLPPPFPVSLCTSDCLRPPLLIPLPFLLVMSISFLVLKVLYTSFFFVLYSYTRYNIHNILSLKRTQLRYHCDLSAVSGTLNVLQ